MTTIDETRRANLWRLKSRYTDSVSNLASALDMSSSQLSQWLNASIDTKTGKPRAMSSASARRAEKKLGLEQGWMDVVRDPVESSDKALPDDVLIMQFDTGGAMGGGLVLQDQPGVIHSWNVSREWLQKNVRNATSAANLCIVTGFGDSMRPLYNPGDPLLVDKGVTTVDVDGIYFFRVASDGFIKRLQRIPGQGVVVISENKSYHDWTVTPAMDFQVFGRVLRAWKGDDYY